MSPENGSEKSEINATEGIKRRRPGRPTGSGKSADKRDLLLDTALKLFSNFGVAQTPLSAIATEAGVTPAMLHYYFKTREQLLDVLIDERYMPVRASMGGAFEMHPNDPVSALTALTQRFIDVSLLHPWFAPLWIREVLSETGVLKQRIDARFGSKERQAAVVWIRKWQDEGRLNPDLEPEFLFISLFGLTLLPVARLQHDIRKGDTSLNTERLSRHIAALLKSGVGSGT
ncbi:TetR/AcrR family transcriptional regulator [Buttiauxella sp. B2]|uniref:TetR/AcrR family transcriptional regulator n=1 Tax=Buttiauxella sp. B2 TaxID=2587812 RepID=UPI001122813D|nr:TetR/AcrR family transcriptional regulator [Buttiauxella sp. B2]TNV20257.1 TetR/AcrR family transcriptional regulator [Buttiauxella sp. B2]